MSDIRSCPGLYCGRTEFEDGSWSDCGACPRGFRTNASSYCQQCFDAPSLYDWQYLGFMVLLPMVLNWFFIDLGAIGKGFVTFLILVLMHAFLDLFRVVSALVLVNNLLSNRLSVLKHMLIVTLGKQVLWKKLSMILCLIAILPTGHFPDNAIG